MPEDAADSCADKGDFGGGVDGAVIDVQLLGGDFSGFSLVGAGIVLDAGDA